MEEETLTPTEMELSQTKFKKKVTRHLNAPLALKYTSLRSHKKQIRLLQNILVSDIRYYQDVEQLETYIVAHNGRYFLYNTDFETIANCGKELMNGVIDYVVDTVQQHSKKGHMFHFYTYGECMNIFETGFMKS